MTPLLLSLRYSSDSISSYRTSERPSTRSIPPEASPAPNARGIPHRPLATHNLRRAYKAAVARAGANLAHLDLRGPHDLRHTFATWLEDAGIPSRVIDELMGHAGGRRDHASGSPMGRIYRETTPAMLARIMIAIDERIDQHSKS
jgi:integrase